MRLKRAAPAKINLTLEILGRREDGYHEIRSVMQAISLHDTLTFEAGAPGALSLSGGNADAPPDENNLVMRAARAMMRETGGRFGAALTLEKRIPAGAGLGGGSSDAAAALLGLNDLWRTRVPLARLMEMGAALGSDVPFFLTRGAALAEGRGERLTPLADAPVLWLALVKPAASLPTPAVYREYARLNGASADAGAAHRMQEALKGGGGVTAVADAVHNDLEQAAMRLCPEAMGFREALRRAGALGVLLCGSGSALFALAESEDHAGRLATSVPGAAWAATARTVSLPWEGFA